MAKALHFQHQPQIHAQIGRVHHGHDGIYRRFAGASAFNYLQRDLFIRCGRVQTINTWQINDGNRLAAGQAQKTDLAFHSHPGVIGHFLAGAG